MSGRREWVGRGWGGKSEWEGEGIGGRACVGVKGMCVRIISFNFFFTSQRLPALPEKIFTRLDKLTRQHRVQEWVSGCGCGVCVGCVWGGCGIGVVGEKVCT